MGKNGLYTREEIFSQTSAWAGALKRVNEQEDALKKIDINSFDQIILTGCGSTYYLSLSAAKLIQKVSGVPCIAVPAGEMLMNPETVYKGSNNLLFAISRSGSTTETVYATNDFLKSNGGYVICITNYHDQPLPELADLVIAIPEGQEKSVAQTRAFSSMLVAVTATAMILTGMKNLLEDMKKLPLLGEELIEKYHTLSKSIGEDIECDRFYFLGSGALYGLACEANLKMKEMTLTHTEPFHFLEFRHGPKSMVTESCYIVGLLSENNGDYEHKVLEEMAGIGGKVISIGEENADISFHSGVDEMIRSILYLPVLQIMAFYRSLKKGLNPDRPKNLSTVVYLE